MNKFLKVAGISLLTAVVGLAVVAGLSLAQGPSGTPTPGDKGGPGLGLDLGMMGGGGDWAVFDAAAKALGLTPEELFSQLHSGKTLTDIATDKGVDIKTVTQAMNGARQAAMKQAIEQAVSDGRMTRDQADWTLKGIQNGWMGGGFGGRGMGPAPAQPQN
jgi:hypothetical protein